MIAAMRRYTPLTKGQNKMDIEQQPINAATLVYLVALNSRGSSPHPDVMDYIEFSIPKRANIQPVIKPVHKVITMSHQDSGVIFALYRQDYFWLRLPSTTREQALSLLSPSGEHQVFAAADVGDEWVRFPMFSVKEESPAWFAAAHAYAAA